MTNMILPADGVVAGAAGGQVDALMRAVLLYDLRMAGVRDEVVDDPFDWLVKPSTVASVNLSTESGLAVSCDVNVRKPVEKSFVNPVDVAVDGAEEARKLAEREGSFRQAIEAQLTAKAKERNIVGAEQVSAQKLDAVLWHGGEPGGVVVVLGASFARAGEQPWDERELTLLRRMLAAVGVSEWPLGWIAIAGVSEHAPLALQQRLLSTLKDLAPRAVWLLGQSAVCTAVGKSAGVEDWHADVQNWRSMALGGSDGGLQAVPLAVTYPPDLLLANPLFKRRAWQQLQEFYQNVYAGVGEN